MHCGESIPPSVPSRVVDTQSAAPKRNRPVLRPNTHPSSQTPTQRFPQPVQTVIGQPYARHHHTIRSRTRMKESMEPSTPSPSPKNQPYTQATTEVCTSNPSPNKAGPSRNVSSHLASSTSPPRKCTSNATRTSSAKMVSK
jgi:hypothetical protein